jgi:hypothetical protein
MFIFNNCRHGLMPNLIKKSWTVSNNYVDHFTKFLIFHNIPGQKIDFHHFPEFDPEDGESGDTLIWYPTDHLRIADKVV